MVLKNHMFGNRSQLLAHVLRANNFQALREYFEFDVPDSILKAAAQATCCSANVERMAFYHQNSKKLRAFRYPGTWIKEKTFTLSFANVPLLTCAPAKPFHDNQLDIVGRQVSRSHAQLLLTATYGIHERKPEVYCERLPEFDASNVVDVCADKHGVTIVTHDSVMYYWTRRMCAFCDISLGYIDDLVDKPIVSLHFYLHVRLHVLTWPKVSSALLR